MLDKQIEELCDEYVANQPLPNKKVILKAKNYMLEKNKEKFNFKNLFTIKNISIFSTCCVLIVASIVAINYIPNNEIIANQAKYSIITNQMVIENNIDNFNNEVAPFLTDINSAKEYILKKKINTLKANDVIAYYCKGKIDNYDCSVLIELQGYCLEDYSNYKYLNITNNEYSITFYSDNKQKIYFENGNYQYNLLINQKINDFNEIYLKINESFNKNL